MRHWNTEIYLMNPTDDRDYFVDGYMANPIGLCEQFNIVLRERPTIPTAQMRYESSVVHGKLGDYREEDNYDNVEITLNFNYISEANARETYHAVSNALAKMDKGTRLRFSDDKDNTYRELVQRPSMQPLGNDLYGWGDFEIELTLKPFRYIEEPERTLSNNTEIRLEQPLPNAMKTAQEVTHEAERGVVIETYKNGKKIYTINNADTRRVIADAELLYTYGGD